MSLYDNLNGRKKLAPGDREIVLDEVSVSAEKRPRRRVEFPIREITYDEKVEPLSKGETNRLTREAVQAVSNSRPQGLKFREHEEILPSFIEPIKAQEVKPKGVALDEVEVVQRKPEMKKMAFEHKEVLPKTVKGIKDQNVMMPEVAVAAKAPVKRGIEMPKYEHDIPKSVEEYKPVVTPVEYSKMGVGQNVVDGRVARLAGSQPVQAEKAVGGVAEGRAARGIDAGEDGATVVSTARKETVPVKTEDVATQNVVDGRAARTGAVQGDVPAERTMTDAERVEKGRMTRGIDVSTVDDTPVNVPTKKADEPKKDVEVPTETEKVETAEAETAKADGEKKAVTSAEEPKFKHTNWWKSPEYEKQVRELGDLAERRREREKRQQRWERNAAILGDIARLGTQVGANAGGAYMIEKETPYAAIANENLKKLRDKHGAEIEAYAKSLREASQKDREDMMNRYLTEKKYEQQDKELQYKQAKDAADRNYRVAKDSADIQHKANSLAETKRHNKAMEMKSAQGKTNATVQKDYDDYHALITDNPEFAVTKKVPQKTWGGMVARDKAGNIVYDEVVVDNPSHAEVQSALGRANAARKKQSGKENAKKVMPGVAMSDNKKMPGVK